MRGSAVNAPGAQKGKKAFSAKDDEFVGFAIGKGNGHPGEQQGIADGEGKYAAEGDPQVPVF